jgi:competence protein ComEC
MVVVTACGLAAVAFGFSIAQWHAAGARAPILEKTLKNAIVEGIVDEITLTARGYRIVVEVAALGRLAREEIPHRLRISIASDIADLSTGDSIRLRATVSPPPSPAMPGAYDFQRHAWFAGLGGVGYATGRIARLDRADEPAGIGRRLGRGIAAMRAVVQQRIIDALPEPARAVALAMVTGDRHAVPDDVAQAMRDSGLAHLLAISGLHLGLVAGFVFFVARGGLALIPVIALRQPIKKWAAAAAIVVAFGYLLLAGAPVPTQRAFIMTGLVLLAIIVDRVGISMRLVGWAAVVVLAISPQALTGASFQMSFGAVVALVAAYEVVGGRLRARAGSSSVARQIGIYVAGVALTSLIAGLATAPFALFHFDRLALYGLAANIVAVPIAALWVMPCAVAAALLMPFGIEAVALVPMGWGLDAIIAVAGTVAAWPGAAMILPRLPLAGLVMIVLGGLWLAIWRRSWRFAGLAGILAGVWTIGSAKPPDILVSGDGRLFGFVAADTLYVSSARTDPFARNIWAHRVGTADWRAFGPDAEPEQASPVRCDGLGCIARVRERTVALSTDARSLAEDCRSAEVIVASVPVPRGCDRPQIVIDRFDLWRDGAHAIWLDETGSEISVRTANGVRGDRPWVPQRPRQKGQ